MSVGVTTMEDFVSHVSEITAGDTDEYRITDQVAGLLQQLLDSGYELPELFRTPDPDTYVMYPVWVAPDKSFSVAAAVWGVGQQTPIHDHGVWGVIGIVQGTESEERFKVPTGGAPEPLGRKELQVGDVDVCCTTDQDVHAVACGSDIACVGLHIYGGDIGEIRRHRYDRNTGEVAFFTSAWGDPGHFAPASDSLHSTSAAGGRTATR